MYIVNKIKYITFYFHTKFKYVPIKIKKIYKIKIIKVIKIITI